MSSPLQSDVPDSIASTRDASVPSAEVGDRPLHALQSPDQAELLNSIDQVRALGIGAVISLPQLIVVGDQSSGKSSVLEAITHVKFPVDERTCTRFATEIALRRDMKSNIWRHPTLGRLHLMRFLN